MPAVWCPGGCNGQEPAFDYEDLTAKFALCLLQAGGRAMGSQEVQEIHRRVQKKDGHAAVLGNKLCSKPTHRARRGPKTLRKKLLALMKQGDGQMNIILAHNTALKAGRRLNKVGKYYDLQPWMSQIKRACVQRAREEDEEHHTAEKCRHCGLTLSSVLPQCGLFFRWRITSGGCQWKRKEAVSSVLRSMWRPIQTFAFFADKAPIRKP